MADENVKNSAEWLENAKSLQTVYEQIAAIAAQLTSVQSNATELAERQRAAAAEELQNTIKRLEAEGKVTDAAQRGLAVRQQEKAHLQAMLRDLTQTDAQRAQALANEQAQLARLQSQHAALVAEKGAGYEGEKQLQAQIASQQDIINGKKAEQLQYTSQNKQEIIETIAAQLRSLDAQDKVTQSVQGTMSTLLGLDSKWRSTFTGAMGEQAMVIAKAKFSLESINQAVSNLGIALKSAASFGNIAGSSIMKIQETTVKMVNTIDQSEIAFRRASGASGQFAQGMVSAYDDREIQKMAGSMNELSQAAASLYANYRRFSETATADVGLQRLAVAANRAGISFDDFSTVVEKSTRIFGEKSTDAMNRLYNSAVAIGEVPSRMVKNYIQSLDTLAQYSAPRAEAAFRGLSSMAKSMGIEMQRLVGVANQFDTFETAADSTARLNAILGGPYLNSIQILNASEEKRLSLLRGALDATNRNWQSLSRWEKKAVSAAAGFQSLSTAAAFFTGQMRDVEELTRKQEEQDEAQRKLIMSASRMVPIMDRLARFMERFGKEIAEKALPVIRKLVDVLDRIGPIGFIAGKAFIGLAGQTMTLATNIRATAAAAGAMTGGLASMGRAAAAMVPQLAVMAGGLYFLNKAFSEEGSPKLYDMPNHMARGLGALAQTGAASSVALRRLGTDLSAIRSPVRDLDVNKVSAFGYAIGNMGKAIKGLPKENVVAVTNVIRESRYAGALGPAATAAAASSFGARASAVVRARQAAAPAGGRGGGQGGQKGVFVTDRIQMIIGGHLIEKTVEDITNRMLRKKTQKA